MSAYHDNNSMIVSQICRTKMCSNNTKIKHPNIWHHICFIAPGNSLPKNAQERKKSQSTCGRS